MDNIVFTKRSNIFKLVYIGIVYRQKPYHVSWFANAGFVLTRDFWTLKSAKEYISKFLFFDSWVETITIKNNVTGERIRIK
jgi:hypothetical protein